MPSTDGGSTRAGRDKHIPERTLCLFLLHLQLIPFITDSVL